MPKSLLLYAGKHRVATLLRKHASSAWRRWAAAIFTALDEQTVVVLGSDAAGLVLPQLATALEQTRSSRDEVLARVEELVEAHPFFGLLMSVPAVGVSTTARTLTEVVGKDFESAGHLASCAGLVPVTRRSGTSIRGDHSSRRGPFNESCSCPRSPLCRIRCRGRITSHRLKVMYVNSIRRVGYNGSADVVDTECKETTVARTGLLRSGRVYLEKDVEIKMEPMRRSATPMRGAEESSEPKLVKSADRTIEVIEALGTHGELTLAEISRQLGIPKSSLHGILTTLQHRNWVIVDRAGCFRLGMRAALPGVSLLDRDEIVQETASLMDWLADATEESVQLARLDRGDVVYLAKRQSPHPVSLVSSVGSRLPAHATALGKILLSERSSGDLDSILPSTLASVTPHTVTDRSKLEEDLALSRERGYAIDDEEAASDLRCFAISLPTGSPLSDALSVSVPIFRLTADSEQRIIRLLLDARMSFQRGEKNPSAH